MTAKTVVIDGVGGQGVRVIGNTMASLLAVMGYEVTLLFDYDSSVRGGMSEAFLTWDREPVSNFVVECADVVLRLADRGPNHLSADHLITDVGLMKPGEQGEEIPFLQLGVEKFGRDLFGNMIALGRLLCVCNVDFTDEHLKEALPHKYVEENIAAIKYGYAMDKDSIRAIVPEQAASSFAERYAERVLSGTAPAEAVEQAAALRP
jgi:Pyruvate/2-oxoacid:ferredoxin oxidoreductase gamma subunit